MRVTIVYDGKCPVCSRLVAASRLRERASNLELVDARSASLDAVQGKNLSNLDFDKGFAVVIDGEVHHGAEGARVLAGLTEPTGMFFRIFQWLVKTEGRSRFWYPILRQGRALLLWILRIPRFRP